MPCCVQEEEEGFTLLWRLYAHNAMEWITLAFCRVVCRKKKKAEGEGYGFDSGQSLVKMSRMDTTPHQSMANTPTPTPTTANDTPARPVHTMPHDEQQAVGEVEDENFQVSQGWKPQSKIIHVN
jgi:hypothetical protein